MSVSPCPAFVGSDVVAVSGVRVRALAARMEGPRCREGAERAAAGSRQFCIALHCVAATLRERWGDCG